MPSKVPSAADLVGGSNSTKKSPTTTTITPTSLSNMNKQTAKTAAQPVKSKTLKVQKVLPKKPVSKKDDSQGLINTLPDKNAPMK